MRGAEPVVEVHGLTKRFGDTLAVNGLSIRIPRGEIFGFLGPNGSGKTTSIRMLCGLLTPDAGSGQCLGYDIRTESALIKRHVGYMTQRFSFYEDLSIEENLTFVARIYGVKGVRAAVERTLESLGLAARRRQLAGTLSGGWKQRLALAACLLHEPQLLLLDEPTAGVDPKARREFWEQVHGLAARGITVLISTHYMDEAERCTRLAYIAYGRLLAEGTPAGLVAQSGLATWRVSNGDVEELAARLRNVPGVLHVVPFGRELHVSGMRSARLEETLEPVLRSLDVHWERDRPRLEDVFIHLMSEAQAPA
jgi:ABC-2 type transport system ATP-binding protein